MTFRKRKIDITLQLGQGSFGESGFDTVKLTGLRCSASINIGNSVDQGQLSLRVWGLPLSIMNRMTLLKQDLNEKVSVAANNVILEAGDDVDGMSIAFQGNISQCVADFSGIPDTSMWLVAHVGLVDALKPVPPKSYRGAVNAAVMMRDIAGTMGRPLENNGVSVMLRDTYLPGTSLDHVRKVAQACDIHATIDCKNGALALWPLDGIRSAPVILLSKDTGMVGYPAYSEAGISVQSLYLPQVSAGYRVQVQSQLTPASKVWVPHYIQHELEAEMPAGKWFTQMDCHQFGSDAPLPEAVFGN
jgi:hypothetical protein